MRDVESVQMKSCIATAASESYALQLRALIGSVRANWPDAPELVVFDIGLSAESRAFLDRCGVKTIVVPPFCPHWRHHYTWKLWCLVESPADTILWLDAGCVVLRPLNEILSVIMQLGYFAIPNHFSLMEESSDAARTAFGVSREYCRDKHTIAAGIFGYRRNTPASLAVTEAFTLALSEKNIKATSPVHRWEQALLSLAIYKHLSPVILCDGLTYGFDFADRPVSAKAIWAARRTMGRADLMHLGSLAEGTPRAYHPSVKPPAGVIRRRLSVHLQTIKNSIRGFRADGIRK